MGQINFQLTDWNKRTETNKNESSKAAGDTNYAGGCVWDCVNNYAKSNGINATEDELKQACEKILKDNKISDPSKMDKGTKLSVNENDLFSHIGKSEEAEKPQNSGRNVFDSLLNIFAKINATNNIQKPAAVRFASSEGQVDNSESENDESYVEKSNYQSPTPQGNYINGEFYPSFNVLDDRFDLNKDGKVTKQELTQKCALIRKYS